MLMRAPSQRGVTLIELMVVVIIIGIVVAMAAPNFSAWIAGSRIRATAESLLAGLQYTRSAATARNAQVRFQLTTSLDASCTRSTSGTSWVVDVVDAADDSVVGRCNTAPSETVAPSILQVRSATEAGGRVQISASAAQVIFNGYGRLAAVDASTPVATLSIDVQPASGNGTCASAGGKVTCLRVIATTGGQVRMCNPSIASGDPQAC